MKHKYTMDRIKRFKRAYPEMADKSDVEILYYLNFHKDLRGEVNRTLTNLKQAISKAERRNEG